tara:strand:+ start:984 stop:1214 length:231 start_codon:yes stop_codon:yes gene_type:complete
VTTTTHGNYDDHQCGDCGEHTDTMHQVRSLISHLNWRSLKREQPFVVFHLSGIDNWLNFGTVKNLRSHFWAVNVVQ